MIRVYEVCLCRAFYSDLSVSLYALCLVMHVLSLICLGHYISHSHNDSIHFYFFSPLIHFYCFFFTVNSQLVLEI